LNGAKTQNSLSFAKLLLAGIPFGLCVLAHVRLPPIRDSTAICD
jgi:hypothetical protein